MPKGFRSYPGASAEIEALVRPHVRDFGRKVESRAKVLYRQRLGKGDEATGATERAIRLDFGPSGLTLTVSANRFNEGVNVGLIGHQGHRRLPVKKRGATMKFVVGGQFVATHDVRAVGGWPFLTMALKQVAAQEGWRYVPKGRKPVNAPLPHVRIAKARRR